MRNAALKRIDHELKDGRFIEFEVYYSLGGMNYFTYKNDARGYYAAVKVVTIEENAYSTSRSFIMGNGFKHLLVEVKRKGKKAALEALKKAVEIRAELVHAIAKKEGVELVNPLITAALEGA